MVGILLAEWGTLYRVEDWRDPESAAKRIAEDLREAKAENARLRALVSALSAGNEDDRIGGWEEDEREPRVEDGRMSDDEYEVQRESRIAQMESRLARLTTLHPAEEWKPEDGAVLWWNARTDPPRMVTHGTALLPLPWAITHWSRIPRVEVR